MIGRALRYLGEERRFGRIAEKYRGSTMIPRPVFIDNLRLASRVAGVSGAVVECGTWKGGMIAGIAEVLGADRSYYLFDSFEGLPAATEIDGKGAQAWQAATDAPDYFDNCRASEEDAREAMAKSPAKDVRIVKGWFEDTLPGMDANEKIALLRMDGDWYSSTRCILDNLSQKVVPGGMIIVDDYYAWEGCTLAVNEYAVRRKWPIRQSRRGVCYIQP